MAVPPAPSFYGDTIPAVVTPTDTIRFRAYCADALTLSVYFEPVQNDPMPIWYEETIEPDDVWGGVPVFYVEIPLAQTSVTAGEWRIGIRAHNNDGYSTHSYKSVRVAELPTVEIASPTEGATVNTLPLVITWNSSDATGISEHQLYVYDEDLSNLVLYRTLDGDARTSVIGIEDAAFENDSEYIVIVGAFNGVGLYASDTVHFSTHWAAPAIPTATVTTDPTDLSASVTAFGNVTYDLGEGESLAVREGGTLTSLTVLGESVQDGTPSPSNPVPIRSVEGRNLLDIAPYIRASQNGLTATYSDGAVRLYGTTTATWRNITTSIPLACAAGKSLTFSIAEPLTHRIYVTLTHDDSTTSTLTLLVGETSRTLALSKNVNSVVLTVSNMTNNTAYDETIYPMLEYGSVAHDYQPYGSISIVSHGKNLLDPTLMLDQASWHIFPVHAPEGTVLTMSTNCMATSSGTGLLCYFRNPSGAQGAATQVIDTHSVTLTVDASGYVEVVQRRASGTDSFANYEWQIELGSTATDYEPYQGTVTPIDLQGNALRSLPDGTHDELTVDADGNVSMVQRVGEVVLNGSESDWVLSGNSKRTITTAVRSLVKKPSTNRVLVETMSDSFTAKTAIDTYNGIVGVSVDTSGDLGFADGSTMTVEAWKTWLQSNPVTVLYPLATPQEIDLGTIDLPYADAGSTVSVDAAVTPTISGTVKTMEYAGQPETDHLVVARVNADGTRWVIADNVESGESVTDPLPPLGVEYSYAITAVTEAGTTSVVTVTHTVETRAWALNFGASAGEVMTFVGNPKASYSLDQGGTAYHFADGGAGNGLPVWYGTTDRDESGTLSFDTKGPQDTDRLRELCREYPVGWIRDPFGHRWRAHVQPKISHGVGDLWAASVTWDAVRWEEAW